MLRLIFDYVNLHAPQGDNFHLPLHLDVGEGLTIRLVMLAIFVTAIAVFAFQADKFLDIRYALRDPSQAGTMRRWSATGFALDAGSLILTLVPFALMSYAFGRDVLARFGVVPFTLAYVLLPQAFDGSGVLAACAILSRH